MRFRNTIAEALQVAKCAQPDDAIQFPSRCVLPLENAICLPHFPLFVVYAWGSCKPSTRLAAQGRTMLVLSRKKDEKIIIGDNITVMVIEIRGDKVRLGIEAPKDITVHRQEVYDAIKREHEEKRDISIDAP